VDRSLKIGYTLLIFLFIPKKLTHTHTHSHTLAANIFNHPSTQPLSLPISLSNKHKNIYIHTHIHSHTHTHSHTLYLSLSLTHTHTHILFSIIKQARQLCLFENIFYILRRSLLMNVFERVRSKLFIHMTLSVIKIYSYPSLRTLKETK